MKPYILFSWYVFLDKEDPYNSAKNTIKVFFGGDAPDDLETLYNRGRRASFIFAFLDTGEVRVLKNGVLHLALSETTGGPEIVEQILTKLKNWQDNTKRFTQHVETMKMIVPGVMVNILECVTLLDQTEI